MERDALIKVTGTGEARADPDLVVFAITVEALTLSQHDSLDQVNSRVGTLKKALEQEGIGPDQLISHQLEVERRWERYHGRGSFQGYDAVHRLTLEVDNKKEILEKVYPAVFSPDLDIQVQVTFTLKDPESLVTRAREKAMEEAVVKADTYARVAGSKRGRLIYVEEREQGDSNDNLDIKLMQDYEDVVIENGPGYETISYNPGELSARVFIYTHFEIDTGVRAPGKAKKQAKGAKNGK